MSELTPAFIEALKDYNIIYTIDDTLSVYDKVNQWTQIYVRLHKLTPEVYVTSCTADTVQYTVTANSPYIDTTLTPREERRAKLICNLKLKISFWLDLYTTDSKQKIQDQLQKYKSDLIETLAFLWVPYVANSTINDLLKNKAAFDKKFENMFVASNAQTKGFFQYGVGLFLVMALLNDVLKLQVGPV